jgi:hypothetical protein
MNGLRAISISYDKYHEPRVSADQLIRIVQLSADLGIAVKIKGVGSGALRNQVELVESGVIAGGSTSVETFALQRILGSAEMPSDIVSEIPVDHCLGPREPWVTPDGELFLCCSPVVLAGEHSPLHLGSIRRQPLRQLLWQSSTDLLTRAIIALGVAGISKLLNYSLPKDSTRCEVCLSLMSDREVVNSLRAMISSDRGLRKTIVGRILVLEAGGCLELHQAFGRAT